MRVALGAGGNRVRSVDAHKVGRGHVVDIRGEGQHARVAVKLKNCHSVSVLIGHHQPPSAGIKLEMPGSAPARVEKRRRVQQAAIRNHLQQNQSRDSIFSSRPQNMLTLLLAVVRPTLKVAMLL